MFLNKGQLEYLLYVNSADVNPVRKHTIAEQLNSFLECFPSRVFVEVHGILLKSKDLSSLRMVRM